MPLKPCLKAAINLDENDVGLVLENFDSYSESLGQKDAALLAVDDAILAVENERQELGDLVHETYPETKPKPKPAIPVPDDPAFSVVIDRDTVKVRVDPELIDRDADNFGYPDSTRTLEDSDWRLEDTQKKYTMPGSQHPELAEGMLDYLAPRKALHEKIISDALAEGTRPIENEEEEGSPYAGKPLAILTGGGGAAGKGSILKLLQNNGEIPVSGFVHVDPDLVKGELPEYGSIMRELDSRAAPTVHEESSDIAKVITNRAIDQGMNIIIDKTLNDPVKTMKQIQDLKEAGYNVRLVGATLDIDTALIRALGRYYGSGRLPLVSHMVKAHIAFNKHFMEYAAAVDVASIYDNTSQNPQLVSSALNGEVSIEDEILYNITRKRGTLNGESQTLRQVETPAEDTEKEGPGQGDLRSVEEGAGNSTQADESAESPQLELLPEPGEFISRSAPSESKPKNPISHGSIERLIEDIKIAAPGTRGISFNVFETQEDALGEGSVERDGRIQGGFYAGTNEILLISENIPTVSDLMTVLRHEMVGHYGLRKTLGKGYDRLLERVYRTRNGAFKNEYQWVAKHYPALVASNDTATIADEMLARAAEVDGSKPRALLIRIYDEIIKLLNKAGLVGKSVSRAEVASLIRSSERLLRRKIQRRGSVGQVDDVGAGMVARIGYHGSPHKFDAFDHSKMGTGEGAQAYGWGTYIAENPDIGKSYTFAIGDDAGSESYSAVDVFNATKDIPPGENVRKFIETKYEDFPLPENIVDSIVDTLANDDYRNLLREYNLTQDPIIRKELIKKVEIGNFYSVDIPDSKIAQMLDWDAPLSEQPESVRKSIMNAYKEGPYDYTPKPDDIGSDLYGGLRLDDAAGQSKETSLLLKKHGIPGIKYFDGNSRTAGEGTRNYVVFDENDMTILSRNGEPVSPKALFRRATDDANVDDLPMDKESRQARAEEQGFDTSTVYYHGTTEGDIRSFDSPAYFSKDLEYATLYANPNKGAELPAMYPVYLKKEGMIDTRYDKDLYQRFLLSRDWEPGYKPSLMISGLPAYDNWQFFDWLREEKITASMIFVDENNGNLAVKVIDPSQVRSINAAFDPNETESPQLLARRATDDANDAPTDGNLGMPDETLKDKFVRLAQDSFNRVKKLQSEIVEQGGRVSHEADVYGAEERSSGKISARLRNLDQDYMQPLLEFMDDNKVSLEELDQWLIAKHAQERNAYIASINDDMPDGGSGMTNQEAQDILDVPNDRKALLERGATFVYAVNDQHLDDMVAGGHLPQEVVDTWRDRWDNYVPLKGKEGEEGRPGTGSGYSVMGAGIQKAMGRGAGNVAESPTAHSFAQAEATIVRTEKTKVGQALIQLIRENPDPNFWTVTQRNFKRFEDQFGEPFEGYDEAPEGMIENLDYSRVTNSKGKIVFKLNPNYKNRDDVFAVMFDGKELLVQIKDPVLMEQLKKMNTTQLNAVVAGFGTVNRYLAMINTALNPEFVITNFERDFQTAMVNLGGEHSAKIAAKVTKNIPGAVRGIWQSTFDTKGQSAWRELYDEMAAEGGTIGFFGLEDIDTKVKHIQKRLINRHGVLGRTKRSITAVRDIVLDANLSVENAARLAAYKVIKEESIANGLSAKEAKAKAASVAKNLTVNFNRKGELAPVLNSAYLFYNASIQGSARIITALKNPRVRKIAGAIAATSFALAMYNRAAGGDDDDDIAYWDKISDYTKQTNLVIMHPDGSGNYSKIRLPYGYNVFYYAGTAMNDLMFGRKSASETSMNMLSAVMNAFNPIQGADLLDTVTPTFLKPVEQDMRNINFMGAPIKPDNPFDNYDRPESDKAFKSTNPMLKEVMAALNEATGGDQTHSGLIDISPEIVKHYVSWLTGGAGMTATRTLGTAINLATDEEIDMKNVPFARTLGGKPGSHFDTQRFYDSIKQVNAVQAQLKLFKGTDDWQGYKEDHQAVHKLAFQAKKYQTRIRKLRDDRDKAYAGDDIDLANEKREAIRQQMMEFSLLYDTAAEADE